MTIAVYKHIHYIGYYDKETTNLLGRFPSPIAVSSRVFIRATKEMDLLSPLATKLRFMWWGKSEEIQGSDFRNFNDQVLVIENTKDKCNWCVPFALPSKRNIIQVPSIDEAYTQIVSFIDGGHAIKSSTPTKIDWLKITAESIDRS